MNLVLRFVAVPAVLVTGLTLLPYSLASQWASSGPEVAPAYAPHYAVQEAGNQPQSADDDIQLTLRHFQFTATTPVGRGGARPRD